MVTNKLEKICATVALATVLVAPFVDCNKYPKTFLTVAGVGLTAVGVGVGNSLKRDYKNYLQMKNYIE